MDDSQRRELSNGAYHRSHGSFELALAPALLALLGFWIDRSVGLTPLFTIVFAVLAFTGVVAKQFYTYRYHMDRLEAERRERAAA